jgi:hypothetical protein
MCELCELKIIDKEFYRDEDFIIISCMSCHVPMAVPFAHIDPESGGPQQLRGRMEKQLIRVALEFYGDNDFYIDQQERSILDHMHWHARLIGNGQ